MNVEQIISPDPPDLLMVIVAIRNPKISEAIWKPFIKVKELVHRECGLHEVFAIIKNNHPTWHSFFWRNLQITKE